MPFFQSPPSLGNAYDTDHVLRAYLARKLPAATRAIVEPELRSLGEWAVGSFYEQSLREGRNEPTLVQWDAWGHRVDRIEPTALWREAARVAAERGIVATAYDKMYGEHARIAQFALAYLFEPSTHTYSCPLAMTDGAARTLLASKNAALVERAVPRLTSRDPSQMWTSGQWMTERTGGSDVARSETIARPNEDGTHSLFGTKWFTSAASSDMALLLARPEGNPPGSGGLALFYLETRDESGNLNGIAVNRLKDKLGTRMLPTAELTLDGARATLVKGDRDGVKAITPMLAATRIWNSVAALALSRRAIALAADYAARREVFGKPLASQPLHRETLLDVQAEFEGAFHLVFRVIELFGRDEAGLASDNERALLRLLTPLAKLATGKQAVAMISECLEAFGGAGYVEDTGLPRLLRDAQVLPIWEGTTNVLSLDVLRVLRAVSLEPVRAEFERVRNAVREEVREPFERAERSFVEARAWFERATEMGDPSAIEAKARKFAMSAARSLELLYLVEQAAWALSHGHAEAAEMAARFGRGASLG